MSAVRGIARRARCAPWRSSIRLIPTPTPTPTQARLRSTSTPNPLSELNTQEQGPVVTKYVPNFTKTHLSDPVIESPFFAQSHEDDPFLEREQPQQQQSFSTPQAPRPAPAGSEGQELTLPLLTLRDMCNCSRCVDPSTRQKLFSTVEIPNSISVRAITELPTGIEVKWENDIPGFDESHKSVFDLEIFNAMASRGSPKTLPRLPARRYWNDAQFRSEVPDMTYEAYMQDDATLHQALRLLHSHGLLFLKDVPESADSVAAITNRIGPLKNTFYGDTWDVRSVPEAKNVAYTSQDLGFHMDLLYMTQPPHLQFLHCIRSSASGGASLFTDSFNAIDTLFQTDETAFKDLELRPITFHYNHADSGHHYQYSRPLIELAELRFDASTFADFQSIQHYERKGKHKFWVRDVFNIPDYLQAVSWAPPFQAPFELRNSHAKHGEYNRTSNMEANLRKWHGAAKKFNDLIHRYPFIHERMMGPGECVIFDNRRVLHARKAFEVADAGKERWLRGAYLDRDPFLSKLRVLEERFGGKEQQGPGIDGFWQEAAAGSD